MEKYIIEGGKKLEGEVEISGSKNAALPIIAACILNGGKTVLYNVPNISDTQKMFEIIEDLGGKVKKKNNKITIDTSKINKFEIKEELMNKMRSSVILAGSLLGKYKKVTFTYPGGCDIGSRPIDMHLSSFKKLGINISKKYGNITCSCDKITKDKIALSFPSVGTTENIILVSCLAEGTTQIINAAMEPEIVDLQNFLNKMGAKISGAGTNTITINGVKKLNEISYNIMPDRIETGTFLCACAMTKGNILLKNTNSKYVIPIIEKLMEIGCKIENGEKSIIIQNSKRLNSTEIETRPYPGFPTDMQSIMAAIFTTAKGTSVIAENIFENRYKYLQELNKMGAKVKIDGKIAIIKGIKNIYGTEVNATDLRGGAALVIAGLGAKGKTTVTNAEYISRGYENFKEKLRKINANIKLEKGG